MGHDSTHSWLGLTARDDQSTSALSLTLGVTCVLVIFHFLLQILAQPLSVTPRSLTSQTVWPMLLGAWASGWIWSKGSSGRWPGRRRRECGRSLGLVFLARLWFWWWVPARLSSQLHPWGCCPLRFQDLPHLPRPSQTWGSAFPGPCPCVLHHTFTFRHKCNNSAQTLLSHPSERAVCS